ncbi:DUF1002 domain-containing protein [Atopobacter phocae]|uniref:DUF1002 domain-containing protein n=1 Tax=Atopobacter phocae TaxID=136492 RepID=UPI00046E75FE|nr:DUF1002 domain-containing protein [Atopobacter phocae]
MTIKSKIFGLTASIGFLLSSLSPTIFADKVEMFTYGESLTTSQYQETRNLLGVPKQTEEIKVQINELNSLLNDNYPYNQVYSSTYITPSSTNNGVEVEIVTPQTITTITPTQYRNAAITAGATNVKIKVASAVRVDGSGALAGVYKAFKATGQALDQQAVQVAQDELNTSSSITQENKDKPGYSDELLNSAIADIKSEIAEKKKEDGEISAQDISIIINNTINNYNLQNVLTDQNIEQLNQFMNRFSELNLSAEQTAALKNLGSDLKSKGGELFNQVKNNLSTIEEKAKQINPEEAKGFLNQVIQFITQLINSIVQLFK